MVFNNIGIVNSNSFYNNYNNHKKGSRLLVIDDDGLCFYISTYLYELGVKVYRDLFRLSGIRPFNEFFIWKFPITQFMIDEIFDNEIDADYVYNTEIRNYSRREIQDSVASDASTIKDKISLTPAISIYYTTDMHKTIQKDIFTNGFNYLTLRIIINSSSRKYFSYLFFSELQNFIYPVDLNSSMKNYLKIPYSFDSKYKFK